MRRRTYWAATGVLLATVAMEQRREDGAERRRMFVALAPHERGAFLHGLRLFVDEMARDAPEKDKK
jgi:hypothetical protein